MDRYLLEFDSERAGGFEPLRFVPKGKTVVLGLITTKEPELESEDELMRRIEQAAQVCPDGESGAQHAMRFCLGGVGEFDFLGRYAA